MRVYLIIPSSLNNVTGRPLNNIASIEVLTIAKLSQVFYQAYGLW